MLCRSRTRLLDLVDAGNKPQLGSLQDRHERGPGPPTAPVVKDTILDRPTQSDVGGLEAIQMRVQECPETLYTISTPVSARYRDHGPGSPSRRSPEL
jgi:hypothetical protein